MFNDLKTNKALIDDINYCYLYFATTSPSHDSISREMLKFKNIGRYSNYRLSNKEESILDKFAGVLGKYFIRSLPEYAQNYVFCLVPSHKSGTSNESAVYYLSKYSEFIRDYFDKDIIIRTKTINKLSMGGDRSIDVHLDSLKIQRDVQEKKVIVIDDITTSGNSLFASKELLLKAGAKEVWLFAFAKTR